MAKNATEKSDKKTPKTQGEYKVGNKRPPVERQFGQPNGNKQGKGYWKKTETARWKFEQLIKMSDEELTAIMQDEKAARFERTTAEVLLNTVGATAKDKDGKPDLSAPNTALSMLERITNQVYGAPKQPVEQTNIELRSFLPKPEKKQ